MFSKFIQNNSAMTFYIISMICLFIANYVKEKNITIYLSMLIIGIVFFVFGLIKRFGSK
jgi:hypothetical protein